MRFTDRMPSPPPWMITAGDPEIVGAALRAADPELGARLRSCRPRRFRLGDDGRCGGAYVLTLDDSSTVVLDADLHAPNGTAPTAPGAPFGHPDWSVHLEDLGLDLQIGRAHV